MTPEHIDNLINGLDDDMGVNEDLFDAIAECALEVYGMYGYSLFYQWADCTEGRWYFTKEAAENLILDLNLATPST